MKINVNIKATGERLGTSGWLKSQIELGNFTLKESNSFYIPFWDNEYGYHKIKTNSLILEDIKNDNSAVIAYRGMDGKYKYQVDFPFCSQNCIPSHWDIPFTQAAKNILETICVAWIEKQIDTEKNLEKNEITITIK